MRRHRAICSAWRSATYESGAAGAGRAALRHSARFDYQEFDYQESGSPTGAPQPGLA